MNFEDIRKKHGLGSSETKKQSSTTKTKSSFEEIRNKHGVGKMTETERATLEEARKGWQKYLDDLEEEKKSENRYAKQQRESGGLIDWIGEKLFNSTQDTTFPMAGTSQVQAALSEDGDAKKPSDAWTQEQKNTFGYLYNTDPEKAYQFAIKTNNSINQSIKDNELAKIKKEATDSVGSGAANTIGAIGTSVFGLTDFLTDIIDTSVYGESVVRPYVSPFEYSQAVTGGISEHLNDEGGTIDEDVFIFGGKGWGDVYGLGTSIAQSAASAYTLGSVGTLISYFGQGAASGVDEAKARGASDDQALLYGTALGTAEGLAEMIGVDNLFKIGTSTTGKELVKNVLKQAGAEGIEEGLTSFLGNVVDNAIMQDKSNFNAMVLMYMNEGMTEEEAKMKAWIKSVEGIAYDTLGGFVSGGVHAGASTGIQTAWSNHKAVQQYGDGSGIVAEALGYGSEGSELKTLADKYNTQLEGGKKLSGGQINQLDQAIASADKENIRKAILKRLGDLGETSDVTPIADALVKQALGEELTRAEKKLLNDNNNAHIIAAELNRDNIKSGGLGNDWASKIGTRRIDPEAYNKELYELAKTQAGVSEAAEKDSVARTVAKSETAVGSNYEASDDGKTKYIDAKGNDRDAVIKQIASTEGGLKIELEGGITVKASDLSFGSKEEALMYEMVARMATTTDTANEIIKSFKPNNIQQATAYFASVPLAYQYGTMNYEAGLKNIKLPDNLKRIAFNRGRADAIAQDKTNTKKPTSKKGSTKTTTKENGIIFEDGFVYDESNANELQKASMVGIETIAKMSSLEVHVFESKVVNGERVASVNGKLVKAPNGYFKDGNKIYIDFAAGNKGEGAMLYTMSHEVTHYIRQWNAKGFRELGDFLMAEYGKKGVPVNYLIEKQTEKIRKRYEREGKALPSEAKLFDMAYEELVADAMSDMLTDPKAYEKLAKLKQKNHSLWKKVGEAIKALLDKLKTALGVYKTERGKIAVAQEAFAVRSFSTEAYKKLQDLYLKAFVEADANYEGYIGSRNLNDLADAKNENGEPLFQYRAMEADEDTYRQMLHKWGKMSDVQIDNLFTTIDNAMELIKDNLEILDYAWESDIDDRAFSPVKPNSDKLYQVSLDFSTLCRKRILQQTVAAQLQEALNKPLTREEGIAIRDALISLQEEGRQIEVACALCYVESARMKSPEQIKRFIENKEKVIKEFFAGKSGGSIKEKVKQAETNAKEKLHKENPNGIKGKDGTTMLDPRTASLKALPKKYADMIRDAKRKAKESYTPTAEEQKLIEVAKGMTVSDFTSPEGLENLAKNYPSLFDAYTSYVRNATKSKGIENDTWWRAGDSMQIGDVLIANMNRENGLRSQSWSDFQVVHILDYIASTIELATRNTKEQAYSKVPDYVELMGNTGVMINMSLIPTATFNGSLDYDSVEGIDYKRALELRDKYHATAGTICIGVDNVQIQLLLADTTIDYVIPYHKSGMAAHIRKAMHIPTWSEYEAYQSEKNLSRSDAEKQAKKYGVQLLDASDPNYQKGTSFSEWFDMKEAQQIAKMENANPSDKAKQKKYGVMYGGYMAMQNAANNYLKLCAERGLTPKFSHEKADFTTEENYWKLLIDRKMVDNVTGDIIEQQTIKPIFNEGEIMRILNDEIARYPKVKADQDYAIRTVTEKMLSGDIKGGMSAKDIAKVMKKPVDNVTNVNILASSEDAKLSERDPYSYKSYSASDYYTNSEIYSYNFLTAQEEMVKVKLPDTGALADRKGKIDDEKVLAEGIKNAHSEGTERDGKVYVKNAYTGRELRIDNSTIKHGLDGTYNRHLTNARIGSVIGSVVKNAIPINGLKNTSEKAIGTYAMISYCHDSMNRQFIAVVTVEQHTGNVDSFELYDVAHAVSGRQKKGSQVDTKSPGVYPSEATTISIAHLLEIVNSTHQSILSDDVLAHFGETRNPKGSYSDKVLFSDRDSYAPTFYSHMGKVIDTIRLEKMGANGVVSYLKGKGVKDEEIKWSGIEAFLEGKKSVTKAELQEFVAGSQLQIVEQTSGAATFEDEDGNTYTDSEFKEKAYAMAKEQGIDRGRVKFVLDPDDGTYVAYAGSRFSGIILEAEANITNGMLGRWSDYKLEGGSNYRELVFQMPNSTFSNQAMRVHWGQDAEGVLVHARIQDMTTSDGKKMLFIEEIQSDWHNEGAKDGYVESKDETYVEKLKAKADDAFLKVEDYSVEMTGYAGEWETIEKTEKGAKLLRDYHEAQDAYDNAMNEFVKKIPDAPFRNNYHEYVLKRLLRMAAEEGYDSIGWTPADIQSKRWSEEFAEAYRIEYDQEMPKFLRKYGKKWGATVGRAAVAKETVEGKDKILKETELENVKRDIERAKQELARKYDSYEKAVIQRSIDSMEKTVVALEQELSDSLRVWSMDITDSMTESVLYEGQVMYSERVTDQETLDFLENQEHIITYKSFVEIDGKLYSPMATKVKGDDGKYRLTNPSEIGVWQQAEEKPDSIPKFHKSGYGYYVLKKDDGGSITAAYNPYEHSSNLVLNDQFEAAYQRPNLVTVECVIPKSEMTSGYKAKYAKDSVGYLDWKSGTVAGKLKDNKRKVYLSRWLKPVRILSDAEVASKYKEILGSKISVPFNVVTPQLRTELEKVGVKIDYEGSPGYQYRQSKKSTDTDVKHSERDSNAVSNRTLLANALESTAQNDIEKTKLSQYKAKIALIESEQAKLEKIRAEANTLRFTKGRTKAETKKMRDLDTEANQIANRISTWDKQLLNLESTTAIKNVLEREKELLRKRLGQKEKQAIRAVKQRAAETQRELLTRYQESRTKAIEGRHKTEVRHKIKNVVSDLNKLLLNPTKDQHVPIGLQLPVAEALDAINMDTMNAAERVAYYNDLIAKSSDPDEIAMLTKKRDFFEYRDANFKERITALKNAYAEFKESDDPLIRNAHNDAIEDLIKNTADAVGNKSLKDMSLAQLEAVYDMYKAILATVRNSNKLFKEGRQETVTGNSEAVKTEVKEVGGHKDRVLKMTKFFKKFGWNMLKPITAMKAIGSKTFAKLFDNVRAAEDTWAVDVSEAKQFYEGVSNKYGFKKWDFKKRYTFKDSTGTDFSLSLEQIMSLYAYSKREQADKHLEFGGFIFDDAIEITEKNKIGIPLKYEVNDANPYRLRKEDLLTVTEALTQEQKAFIDEMQTYLSEVMGAKGNEVSLAMYDIKLYTEKTYFPLKTSRYFREFDPEKSGTPKIKNSGFSKKTVPQAGNPIVLANFMDVWASHVNDMSMYHAFVLPLEDFMRVYNYSSTAGGYDSVQQYIKNAYGAQANQYIEKLMDDLNGGARVDSSAGVINKGLSLFKKASVFASASVVVQQPSAIARAFAYINPKYFITSTPSALNLAKHKAKWAEVKKYAPVAVIKEMGYFDTGVGRSTVDWLKGNKNFKDKMDDVLSKAPAIADELAWTHIWEAVKRETAAKKQFKVGSEEFLKECGKRFTEVVTNTQVYDSVLARSGMMRSKDTGMKMATAFMAEPTTTVNMMVDGIIQGKRGNKKFTAATVGAVSSSIILNSILVALVYAARDDDEDETYTEKYLGSLTSELLDGFNPLTYVPFVKDIWSIAQGYDVERSDMSVVSKLWESIEGLFNEDKSGWEKVLDTTGAVSSLFGIPLKNIIRDAKGMYNLTETILSDTPTTKAGIAESVEDAVTSSIPLYDRLHESDNNADRLYKAILSGDQAQIDRIKGRYKDDKAIESAMRQALREHDSRIKEAAQARYDGDISEYTRIAKEIIAEGNFSQDTIVGAINSEITAIKNGESTETEATEDKDEATSIYKASDINAAFENGDNAIALEIINDLVNTKVANGMERDKAKSSVRSSMTSYWKPLYKQAYQSGNTTEMERIRRILYSSGLYGRASDVVKTVKTWLKD